MKKEVLYIIIAVLFVMQVLITWGFMFWTWNKILQHENALVNHTWVIQQLLPQKGK